MKRVCDNIAELFIASGKTQQIFGECIGSGQGAVGHWTNRQCDPNSKWIPRIAEFFGVPIDRLFEGVE